MKIIKQLFECVCPICGNRGILLSHWKPQFYCIEDKVEYNYDKEWMPFFGTFYVFKYYVRARLCKKHKESLKEEDTCYECDQENIIKLFIKKGFTKKQINFLKKNNYELSVLFSKL